MLKIQPTANFWTDVVISAPGGAAVATIPVQFKAMRRSEFDVLMQRPAKEVLHEVVLGWREVEDAFSIPKLDELLDTYPASQRQFLDAFVAGLFASGRKN
jgi:hypothetical protein